MRRHATATTLTSRQKLAIEAIVATGDVTIAAQSVGVNRATLYRWMKQSAFVQAVHVAEADAVEDLSRMSVNACRSSRGNNRRAVRPAGCGMASWSRTASGDAA